MLEPLKNAFTNALRQRLLEPEWLRAMQPAHTHLMARAASHAIRSSDANSSMGVVFSMDRALQLHALLGSYRDHVRGGPRLDIIYRATTRDHHRAYAEVLEEFRDVLSDRCLDQGVRASFRPLLIELLRANTARIAFFLVDDNLFIEPVEWASMAAWVTPFSVPSLRMGEHLRRSYTMQRAQPLPATLLALAQATGASEASPWLRTWCWAEGQLDWGYPLSVDGHLFDRAEMLSMTEAIDFSSPNTYEAGLQTFKPAILARVGICHAKARLLNIPYNRVQSDFENIHAEVHQDEMLGLYLSGKRINRLAYYGVKNISAHQDFELLLNN